LSPGFPVFWAKVLESLDLSGTPHLAWHRPGEEVRVPVGQTSVSVERVRPVREAAEHREVSGMLRFAPRKPGVYSLTGDARRRLIAFTACAPAESSTSGAAKRITIDDLQRVANAERKQRTPLTAAFAALALASAMGYWYTKQ
jgi:hypothetical protein